MFYEKIHVPSPTWCPECRLIRRLAWRNIRSIYRRKCDLCGEDKIGVYSPDKPYNVYCAKCWWSDDWDARDYGQDYDFSRPFFEQFNEFMKKAPLLNRFVLEDTMVRSDYTNMAQYLKDCYLVFHGDNCERCMYCDQIDFTNDCIDCSYLFQGELCYESINLLKCNKVFYSLDSESCYDCYFVKNCVGCNNCFGCVGLRNKQYYIFNQPYSKDTYFKKLKEIGFDPNSYISVEVFRSKSQNLWNLIPVKYIHGIRNVNVTGDYVNNSKNAYQCFHSRGLEDCKFCAHIVVAGAKDSYDWTQYGENGELIYEVLQCGGNIFNNKFGWCFWRQTKNTEYGILNINSSDCFGCISIKNKQYCILNKQYSKSDYAELKKKIIQHMDAVPYIDKIGIEYRYGEFFPMDKSPFGYNESFAQEEFVFTQKEAENRGYTWADKERFRGKYIVTKKAEDLADNINTASEEIMKEVIGCSNCGRAYKIIEQEFSFYKNNGIPLPRLCFECRYLRRIKFRNPSRIWHRTCECQGQKSKDKGPNQYTNTATHFHGNNSCPNEFETSYAPERPEIVYCEQCYQAEVA